MEVSEALGRLVCGEPEVGSALAEVLEHSRSMVIALATEVENLRRSTELGCPVSQEPTQIALLGPFFGRSLLELCLTALLGRFDPFRVLLLREMQMRPDYAPGKRNLASIQWAGDIHADRKIEDLWKADRSLKDMPRALLGDYYEHLFWQRAFRKLLDHVPDGRGGDWMLELRRLDADGFVPSMRRITSTLYSSCSKGVHHEFVIPLSGYYDPINIKSILDDGVKTISILAFVGNASLEIHSRLSIDDALACFEKIQECLNVAN